MDCRAVQGEPLWMELVFVFSAHVPTVRPCPQPRRQPVIAGRMLGHGRRYTEAHLATIEPVRSKATLRPCLRRPL